MKNPAELAVEEELEEEEVVAVEEEKKSLPHPQKILTKNWILILRQDNSLARTKQMIQKIKQHYYISY